MDREMLGRFIAQRRKELNLTQRELAEALHVTDKAVSKWERGAGCPDISLLEPLAAALGLSVDQLLTYQTAPAEPEAAEEETAAPASPAVQAVLDMTLAERRARRRRRWFITMTVTLSLIVLAVVGLFLYHLQSRGKLFFDQRSISPDGSITVETYSDFNGQGIHVVSPDVKSRRGDGSGHGMGIRLAKGTKVKELVWSEDGAYLAFSRSETDEADAPDEFQRRADLGIWHFYRDESGQLYGENVHYTLWSHLAHLWEEGDEHLVAAFPDVKVVYPSGAPIFDITQGIWHGSILRVVCVYTSADGDYQRYVSVDYDPATRQVLSAE